MIRAIWRRVAVLTLAGALAAVPAWADDPPGAEPASDEAAAAAAIEAAIAAHTEEAKAMLKESADFLAAQEKFAIKANIGFDVVQVTGQKLEFGSSREITVRRPDRLRIDAQQRDGDRASLFFDGEQISVDLPDENAYVAIAKPGTLDAAIDYLVDDLQTPAPLHEFVTSNFYTDVEDKILAGFYVEEATVGKRQCHHLAFRAQRVDFQIWIEDGDRPLPCSLVITYKHEEASPQFWASFHSWDLSPSARDKHFRYSPPEGAEKLSLQTAIQEIREDVEVQ